MWTLNSCVWLPSCLVIPIKRWIFLLNFTVRVSVYLYLISRRFLVVLNHTDTVAKDSSSCFLSAELDNAAASDQLSAAGLLPSRGHPADLLPVWCPVWRGHPRACGAGKLAVVFYKLDRGLFWKSKAKCVLVQQFKKIQTVCQSPSRCTNLFLFPLTFWPENLRIDT